MPGPLRLEAEPEKGFLFFVGKRVLRLDVVPLLSRLQLSRL